MARAVAVVVGSWGWDVRGTGPKPAMAGCEGLPGRGRRAQEVFMTDRHLAIAMEYAPGGDLSEYVDACKRAGVPYALL